MRIKNLTDSNFDQTIFGVKFDKGISLGHFNQNQLDKLKAIGRFEFAVINEPCPQCEIYKKEIEELKSKKKHKGD
ncbi:MAG: hypothetical protein WC306_03395 [Candidatus Paceibacterota bacterium]|jgi:hypothetical protein